MQGKFFLSNLEYANSKQAYHGKYLYKLQVYWKHFALYNHVRSSISNHSVVMDNNGLVTIFQPNKKTLRNHKSAEYVELHNSITKLYHRIKLDEIYVVITYNSLLLYHNNPEILKTIWNDYTVLNENVSCLFGPPNRCIDGFTKGHVHAVKTKFRYKVSTRNINVSNDILPKLSSYMLEQSSENFKVGAKLAKKLQSGVYRIECRLAESSTIFPSYFWVSDVSKLSLIEILLPGWISRIQENLAYSN